MIMVGAAILLKPILHESLRIQHVTFYYLGYEDYENIVFV